jgi:hypothetical protein
VRPTLSADVISLNSGDLWHEMRFGLGYARADADLARVGVVVDPRREPRGIERPAQRTRSVKSSDVAVDQGE